MTELTTPAGDAVREKYRREGAAQERERILALLQSTIGYGQEWDYETELQKVIDAIKGFGK